MTLAFALRGSNGLVLAADSRSSAPGFSEDNSTKFLQINREVGTVTYGLTEVGYRSINRLYDEVNQTNNFSTNTTKRIVHFSDIGKIAQTIFRETFLDFLAQTQKEDPSIKEDNEMLKTGFILAGYDANESNQFRIIKYQSPNFEPEESTDILAAQWHISQFIVDHMYWPEMDIDQLKRLAVFMLIETETVSSTVGGQLKIATITLDNGFQRLNENEVQKIIEENQPRFAKYRKCFNTNLRQK